ncbi:MAG TPA: DUF4259 domain-containing protein [Pyrinomonadaceae bacterium]|nr:DUF4259 domain-containing protein [Pyrinomonadaceae bacterium]
MGTWSHEPFGNDTAIDWAYELEHTQDFLLVEQAIQRVLDCGPEYLDADWAVEAIAAAEIIAKALGRGTQSDAYTEEVDAWLKSISAVPTSTLRSNARQAMSRILGSDSELKELWEQSEELESWESSVRLLQSAMGA